MSPEDQQALQRVASMFHQPVASFLRGISTGPVPSDKGRTSSPNMSGWNNGYNGLRGGNQASTPAVNDTEPSNDLVRDDDSDEFPPQDPITQDWASASDFLEGANRGRAGVLGSMNTWIDEFSSYPEPVLGNIQYQQPDISRSIMAEHTVFGQNDQNHSAYTPVYMTPFSNFQVSASSEAFPSQLYRVDNNSRIQHVLQPLDLTTSMEIQEPMRDVIEDWEPVEPVTDVPKSEMSHSNSIASSVSDGSIPAVSGESPITPSAYSGSVEHGFELIPYVPNEAPKPSAVSRPQRRGGFRDQRLREETAETRRLKACVRCRMQKIRVSDLNIYTMGLSIDTRLKV